MLLSGEPGIGESRLTAALMERLANEPHTRLRYFCSPQHTDSALYPNVAQMERAAGFVHDDTVHAKLDKLDVLLSQSFAPPHDQVTILQSYSLYKTTDVIRSLILRRSGGASEPLKPLHADRFISRAASGFDDLRGRSLDRPYEFGGARAWNGSDQINGRAAYHHAPP